ncbi:uncharacterized protein LOC126827210 [Patella vulgata]|uniref:uncharacterized protein LOC126827210 n=1 Tax=Patella vulgata TaxID=6465 RepID=UPI00217FA1F8|nr:uncharacterized protein LOC126827210 [Patella vulgata]XP_050412407.1 uncharacterized protein LOC126827210 [Patella vulgata]
MGAAHSKRQKYKRKKEEVDDSLYRDLERLRSLSKTRLNRLSADIENMNTADYLPHEYKMCDSVEESSVPTVTDHPTIQHNINLKYPQSVRHISLDDHPVLTKLQNKQNARLESMEQRMERIRTNAMQAAERRKFAHMFKAKNDVDRTNELLKEATNALEEMKRQQKQNRTLTEHGDQGEIIPVKILQKDYDQGDQGKKKHVNVYQDDQTLLIGGLRLNDPITWLLLPLMLPIVLIVYLMRGIMTHHPNRKKQSSPAR